MVLPTDSYTGLGLGHRPVGRYIGADQSAYWDGKVELGEVIPSGTYLYQLQADAFRVLFSFKPRIWTKELIQKLKKCDFEVELHPKSLPLVKEGSFAVRWISAGRERLNNSSSVTSCAGLFRVGMTEWVWVQERQVCPRPRQVRNMLD